MFTYYIIAEGVASFISAQVKGVLSIIDGLMEARKKSSNEGMGFYIVKVISEREGFRIR